jgi:Cof subfamily protein (haloacid dehalogenase superfamily)
MKNMTTNYKLVVSDLDGTLLSNFHVPNLNKSSIQRIREKGIKFCITTGRTIQSTKNILKEIGTYNEENEYSILFNGCVIIENKNNKVLFFKGIDFEISNKLFEIGKKYDVMLLVYSIDNCYVWKSYEKEIERQKSYEELLTFMDDLNINFIKEKNIQITKIVFVNEDHNYLLKIKEELDKIFGNEISISTSANMYLEINAKNVNKGNALEWLANYLKIDMKETIAIGDNSNDIFMIEKAGIGVCVKNGIDSLKNKANYVTEKTNDEGAVKEVLDKFVLGE